MLKNKNQKANQFNKNVIKRNKNPSFMSQVKMNMITPDLSESIHSQQKEQNNKSKHKDGKCGNNHVRSICNKKNKNKCHNFKVYNFWNKNLISKHLI